MRLCVRGEATFAAISVSSDVHFHPSTDIPDQTRLNDKRLLLVTSISTKKARLTERPRIAFLDPVILFPPERLHFLFRVRRSKKAG